MAEAQFEPTVHVKKAAELSGLSIHMLTYLSRLDILKPTGGPPGRGRRRRYTFNDVLFLRVIADLLRTGIEVKRLSQALKRAKAEADAWMDIRRAPRRYLVTDGTEVFLRTRGHLESKTRDRQLAFAFVLDLEKPHAVLAADWPKQPQRAGISAAR